MTKKDEQYDEQYENYLWEMDHYQEIDADETGNSAYARWLAGED